MSRSRRTAGLPNVGPARSGKVISCGVRRGVARMMWLVGLSPPTWRRNAICPVSLTERWPMAMSSTGSSKTVSPVPHDLAGDRIAPGEEADLGGHFGRRRDEHGLGAIAQGIAGGQAAEDRILVAREQDAHHAAAGREERRSAAVAQHEAVAVHDRGVARPRARGDRALVGQGAARARVDAHVAREALLGREGDHAGVVDRGRAEVDERRRAARDLHGPGRVEAARWTT